MSNVLEGLPALNVDLLSDIVIWAAQDAGVLPKPIRLFDGWGKWEQSVWSSVPEENVVVDDEDEVVEVNVCNTAFCMAGQAAVQTGHRFEYQADGTAEFCFPAKFNGLDGEGKPLFEQTGEARWVSEVGRESLGLHKAESSTFFDGDNSFGKIAWLALGFAKVRGVELKVEPEIIAAAEEWHEGYNHWDFAEWLGFSFADKELQAAYQEAYDNGPVTVPEVCATCGK